MVFDVLIIGGGVAGMQCALVIGSGLKKPFAIEVGGTIMPNWNHLANSITGFTETDEAVESSTNIYPG